MILSIEDKNGETIGAVKLTENNINGDIEIDFNHIIGDISIADIDYDDIFDTNDKKIRIQLE